ncbi:bifunctional nitrate reductase/sulfite reductase flavoprotein subunit alpha [Nonomuraea sp. NEAU-A123]|uniref:bifunctional nitrate reductase/sulfite reductase flavoprotein subunit alpha n=1 Tax=Nonomuraea sp. NEAU-A123 TaxID=2839649 RepID=UPI001BE3FAA6|nr:bifunctional nitrate reductase/sulfite reductase flavoprotein subunit alpha [Nonomuraea sp. NEAU-A123]MBT2234181.1 bifunctional nitrate reductase/sulfite reductase flavoprotein subunit alpha [Nonomuraea sp. NEAU-A123]
MTATDHPQNASSAVKTVCSYCGVGCGMVLEVAQDGAGRRRVVKASGDKSHPANFGRLCAKGATSADLLAAPGRLTTALARADRGAGPAPADMDAAITATARRLRGILDEHGPDALAFYVSGQMTLEAQYLANKLAKGFVRTNQIESNSRLCMASAGTGYKLSLGSDGPPGSYDDFKHADVFFVIGANMADCHPILFLRLMERVKAGATLIVVDPRRTATAAKAGLHLQIRPGTDLALLNGLLHLLVENGHVDEGFIAEFTEGWEAMPPFLRDYPPAKVAEITGIPEADIRRAAQLIGAAGEWMSCWTMGLNQSTHGTWNTNALCNLHLATGAICRPGSGPFSLTGQPNAMGGREMGYMGPGLPGQRSVLVEEDRRFVENLWGIAPGTLRTDVGKGTIEMFSRMADGEIKACWIICTNPVASVANRKSVIQGLEAAEFVVTQDAFAETETNAYADVVLPAALWTEGEGVMINSERNLTLLRPAVDPPGQALPDWQIIARVACEMGFADAFDYGSAEEIFEEIKRAWNPKTGYDLRGVAYDRLRATPVQWPSASADGGDRNPIRYLNDGASQDLAEGPDGSRPRLSFPTASGRAVFFPRPHLPAAELPDDDFPFVLNTGRLQHQWHTMTKTGKVAKLNKLNPGPFVEIHPGDAGALGIGEGDAVRVASRRGQAVLPAVVTDRVRPGDCFAPFHWNDLFGEYLSINAVTNDAVDPISFQPEFKVCAVSLTRVAAAPSTTGDGDDLAERPATATAPLRAATPPGGGAVADLARLLGLADVSPPVFADHERRYLAGFLAGLGAAPPSDGAAVPVLPESAPFAPDQALWVNGTLAGMFSRTLAGRAEGSDDPAWARPAPAREERELVVLWASQTGNAEDFALATARHLSETERAPTILSMAECTPAALPRSADLLIITSTFGDGDAPDNGTVFWESLTAPEAPRLDGVRYSVLAFGDSSYDDFCAHGRRLDQRMGELGAVRLAPRVDCEPDDEQPARQWLDQVLRALATPPTPTVPGGAAGPAQYSKNAPLLARLSGNRLLSLPGAVKEVRQFVFDTGDVTLPYEAGDALGVWSVNHPDLVAEWLAVTGLDPAAAITAADGPMPLGEALHRHRDITRITPDLLRFVAERSQDRHLKKLLRPDNKNELAQWIWGRQAIDVIAEFPVRATAQEWADVLKRLQPRLYSISSSPLTSPREIRLTVSVVRFDNQHGSRRNGACSAHLADAPADSFVPVFVQHSPHFRPPADPATPMVMVGPGTGIAPFLGFLDERRTRGDHGRNWLFFGEQHRATDFYYQDELAGFQRAGTLSRLDLAFSRDQRAKVYVQDRMREHGARLWSWLQDGAHFYVCGDAGRMARDVDHTLREIAAAHGGLTEDDAAAYVKKLAADKRYVRDVY